MAKFRVYEIAREFQLSNKEVMDLLEEIGVHVKSHNSTISEAELVRIKEKIEEYKRKPKEEKKPEKPQKEKPEPSPKVSEKKEREEKKPGPSPERPRKPQKLHAKKEERLAPKEKEEKKAEPITTKRLLIIQKKKKKEIKFPKEISVVEGETIKDIAEKLNIKAKELIERLHKDHLLVDSNDIIDSTLAHEISRILKININFKRFEESLEELASEGKQIVERAPIVTIMGHVDHGKTTLLDYIRKTRVAEKEAGGITQHIGAYRVEVNGKPITFIDTPGHEAFTKLRARGAQVTDLVVLVVAADDGVMPQTIEAINHAKAAGVPIIVAINKIDKPEANPERVKQQLAERGLIVEEWGGDTVAVEISAKTGKGVDELLEMIVLMGELLELKAPLDVPAQGTILISKVDPKKGVVGTAIIQKGVLRLRDTFVAGITYGRVKGMFDEFGKPVREVGPSMPVEIIGFEDLPNEGDKLFVVKDLEKAKAIVELRKEKISEQRRPTAKKITLEELFAKLEGKEEKELRLIIKADVIGSMEALRDSLERLSSEEVKIKILHQGTGPVSESDVLLASASEAIVIGYNVKAEKKALDLAQRERVQIRLYNVIYEIIKDIKDALKGMLAPKREEVYLGRAEIKKIFRISKVGMVAGCIVVDGKIRRNALVKIKRGEEVIHEGKIASLKHYKDDVEEVRLGSECGIRIENFNDFKEGDLIEAYEVREV